MFVIVQLIIAKEKRDLYNLFFLAANMASSAL